MVLTPALARAVTNSWRWVLIPALSSWIWELTLHCAGRYKSDDCGAGADTAPGSYGFFLKKKFIFQEQTLRQALTGVDMLAKAKTGTGKTLAFLIPSIQQAAAAKEKGSKSIKVQKKIKERYIVYSLSLIDLEP